MSYTGQCNGCGLCCRCFLEVAGQLREFRCRELVVLGPLGKPGATFCRVHAVKYPGMPIALESAAGDQGTSDCAADYPRDQDAVPPECSYVYVGDPDKKPKWTPDFLPASVLGGKR